MKKFHLDYIRLSYFTALIICILAIIAAFNEHSILGLIFFLFLGAFCSLPLLDNPYANQHRKIKSITQKTS